MICVIGSLGGGASGPSYCRICCAKCPARAAKGTNVKKPTWFRGVDITL